MSKDVFYEIMERVSRRMKQQRVTPQEWFQKADLDRDNLLSVHEFVQELIKMPIGVGVEEMR
jgi:hypothetical protein